MDEFHSFNDPERGIVWELTLGLLPAARPHATACRPPSAIASSSSIGSPTIIGRRLELVQSDERKVPLTYLWVGDMLLNEFLESIAGGDERIAQDPGTCILLQSRHVLECSRAGQGQEAHARMINRSSWRGNWNGSTGRKGPVRNCVNYCCVASAFTTPASCQNTSGLLRISFSASYWH